MSDQRDNETSEPARRACRARRGPRRRARAKWVAGDEPMTAAQRSHLGLLAREAGAQLPADLTEAQACEHIDRLQPATGRGVDQR